MSIKKDKAPTRAQITARDHSGLSTYSLNLRISTMQSELKNLQAESADAKRVIEDNAPRISNLRTDIAALEGVVERRR
jgi:capsule polysaccharide export protein KpsE/RkpR